MDGTNAQSAALSSSGVAQFILPGTPVGTHSVLVSFAGDAHYTVATPSQGFKLMVAPAAIPPSFSLDATPSSLSIKEGQTGSTTLQLTPTGGYSGTVVFSCQNLPANAACVFAQSPIKLTGDNQPVSVGLTVHTNVPQARLGAPLGPTPLAPIVPALAFWWPDGLAGLAAFGQKDGSQRRGSDGCNSVCRCWGLVRWG
jgi:hypothetical protein